MNINLEKLIKNHGGQWVALDENLEKVIASSKSAKTALNKAEKKGIKIPHLFKVPTRLIAYIGRMENEKI